MPFDPNYPPTNAPLLSEPMRDNFNGLNDKIDAIPAGPPGPEGPQGPPGPVHFFITEPAPGGAVDGDVWLNPVTGELKQMISGGWDSLGNLIGPAGAEGPQGPPGDVNTAQLNAAIAGTSNNTNGVGEIDTSGMTDPDAIAVANKVNELILAARR